MIIALTKKEKSVEAKQKSEHGVFATRPQAATLMVLESLATEFLNVFLCVFFSLVLFLLFLVEKISSPAFHVS